MQERPLSPHLQVYKPQLTSTLSILHRGTGVFLSAAALFVVYWIYALSQGPVAFAGAQAIVGTIFGKIVLLGVIFSTFYHLANGIRHLLWDTGYGLEIKSAYQTGWIVVAFSLAATAVCGAIVFGVLK
ncbi:MAG: succinate dehydrogenase, cytochrome b556 subunit [Pseudomonadota bacterium]